MNTENLFYGSFFAIVLAVVFLGWSWISPPKSAPYGTYNPMPESMPSNSERTHQVAQCAALTAEKLICKRYQ